MVNGNHDNWAPGRDGGFGTAEHREVVRCRHSKTQLLHGHLKATGSTPGFQNPVVFWPFQGKSEAKSSHKQVADLAQLKRLWPPGLQCTISLYVMVVHGGAVLACDGCKLAVR